MVPEEKLAQMPLKMPARSRGEAARSRSSSELIVVMGECYHGLGTVV
jgi:hypothetical protein